MTQWIHPRPVDVPQDLRAAVGGHPLLAETLVRRGFASVDGALRFLDPAAYEPADPHDLPDLSAAAERLRLAVRRGERIAILGDFDADGQTATALLLDLLRALDGDVLSRVPSRERGHGVHPSDIDHVAASGARLVVTCDTGITAHAALSYAQTLGVDVIVTDHHVPGDTLPSAIAVVNPHRLPPSHPMGTLSGVAVAYELARALDPGAAEQSLDLVAIGLIADVAALVGDARYLVQRGLEMLRHTGRAGLQAMYKAAEISGTGITEEHVGFVIAPRLNAMGRLADAALGVELLTTGDPVRARILASEVEGLNSRRQWLTKQIMDAALAEISRKPALLADYSALVLSHPAWPAGVIGIVAGRLAERFGKPAVLISVPPGGRGSGSGRSVTGIDLLAAIRDCAPLLARFGGHAAAAGFSIEEEHIPEFRAALSRAVGRQAGASTERSREIDAWVGLPDLTLDLVASTNRIAPFGPGNPPLALAVRSLKITSEAKIGRTAEHRRLVVEDPQGDTQTVFWWYGAGWPLPHGAFDLVLTARASDYRGQTELQLEWLDAAEREPEAAPAPTPPHIAVCDLRAAPDPRSELLRLSAEGALQIWAEGQAVAGLPSYLSRFAPNVTVGGRHQLARGSRLAIWALPPGFSELRAALRQVRPQWVFVFSVDPGLSTPPQFLRHLAGICKFAVRERGGRIDIESAAAAAAHRSGTIRAGLDVLETQGKILILDRGPDAWRVVPGESTAGSQHQETVGLLSALTEETAAYRDFLRFIPETALAAYISEATRDGEG